jgi:hypothetical protein
MPLKTSPMIYMTKTEPKKPSTQKQNKGITNTLALPIDKMTYIYILCPIKTYLSNAPSTSLVPYIHTYIYGETLHSIIHILQRNK